MPETKVKKVKKPASSAGTPKRRKAKEPGEIKKKLKYFKGLGRRKTATAQVRLLVAAEKAFSINGKPLEGYFTNFELKEIVLSPLKLTDCLEQFGASVKVKGGGLSAQADAIRHGISKALVSFNPDLRKKLKKAGFLTRDPRMRERKKFGLKRARRAPQWAKR